MKAFLTRTQVQMGGEVICTMADDSQRTAAAIETCFGKDYVEAHALYGNIDMEGNFNGFETVPKGLYGDSNIMIEVALLVAHAESRFHLQPNH